MGGELWLMLKSPKECNRAVSYLGGNMTILEGKVGWWPTRKSAKAIEVDYNANHLSSSGAYYVAREIAKRFAVTRIGASSVGWYPDKEWEPSTDRLACCNRYGSQYKSWADWIKDYKLEFDHSYWSARKHNMGDMAVYLKETATKIETEVVALFEKVDEAAGEAPDGS